MTRSYNVPRFPKMPKFAIVKGGAPDPGAAVKKRVRKSARDWPCCRECGGRETVQAKIGNVSNKLCVACLLQGRRVVIE